MKTSNLYIAKITKVKIILFLMVGFSRIDLSFLITFSMNGYYAINYFFLAGAFFSTVALAFGVVFVAVVFFTGDLTVFGATTSTSFFSTGFFSIIFFSTDLGVFIVFFLGAFSIFL